MRILPLVVVGILLGQVVTMPWWVAIIGGAICSIVALVPHYRRLTQLYAVAAIILWSMGSALLKQPYTLPEPNEPTTIRAHIVSTPHSQGRWQRCDATIWVEGESRRIILNADTCINISLGEYGRVRGYLNPLPEGSYGSLMQRRGYIGQLYATRKGDWQASNTLSTPLIEAQKIRNTLVERLERLDMDEDAEAVTKAMLLGAREDIDRSLRTSYSRAGASHILAISGLHVGIVAMVVWWLTWFIPIIGRRGHIWRNLCAALIMLLYATITGLSPSVVRATIMFLTAQVALAYGTSRSALNLLTGAATLMLLINPNNLFDISFQLSVIAVAGIALGMEPAKEFFAIPNNRLLKALLGIVLVGICSTLVTLPLVAHTFSTVSLVGIFLNPLVILTAQIIVLGGLIWVTLPLDFLSPVARWIIEGAAQLQNNIVSEAASLPWAALQVEIPKWIVWLCYLLMVVVILVADEWKTKKRWRVEEKS